ncbi:MAG: hypothetical protein KKD39_03785 [Candidatus Altiarchaeota archaeon]|nr:hypothetical protein [Candidatus Altiarchaeota archaeon]
MLKYFIVAGVVLIAIGLVMHTTENMPSADATNETANKTFYSQPARNRTIECVIDLDCGESGYTDYFCWEDFVVRDYIRFTCYEDSQENMRCNKSVEKDAIQLCRDDEKCVEGKDKCQPKISCDDGVKNQGETGIDCGGPCDPCNSCNNRIKDGDEESIDCGGSICPDCTIYCERNESCGIPRWSKPYCGKDTTDIDIVLRDYVSYECKNPGTYDSFCIPYAMWRISDYCGPLQMCVDGICYDKKNPDLPTPSEPTRKNAPPHLDGEVYTTCRGNWCYEVKIPPQ